VGAELLKQQPEPKTGAEPGARHGEVAYRPPPRFVLVRAVGVDAADAPHHAGVGLEADDVVREDGGHGRHSVEGENITIVLNFTPTPTALIRFN
jgi:hypothetical protein